MHTTKNPSNSHTNYYGIVLDASKIIQLQEGENWEYQKNQYIKIDDTWYQIICKGESPILLLPKGFVKIPIVTNPASVEIATKVKQIGLRLVA